MSWFRVDDKSAFHRKVLKAGNEAWGALCRAGAVSAGEGTDGRVTPETMAAIAPPKVWDRLISAGLMERIEGSPDLQIHDYLQWNPSAAEIEEQARSRRARANRGAAARWGARGRDQGDAQSNASSMPQASAEHVPEALPQAADRRCTQPNPTQPNQKEEEIAPEASEGVCVEATPAKPKPDRRKPSKPMPHEAETPQWLAGLGIDASDPEAAKFVDYHRARDSRFADWRAAWRTWQRNAKSFAARGGGPAKPGRFVQRMPQPSDFAPPAPEPDLFEFQPQPEDMPW